ncbi:SseB family protein [Thalassobius sp. I31.1]|uniref:SseB family protein n=1 Tax=Thalassobius sp. I31.1 TaxID=2109912 RepID=UPI000D1BFFD7|nr:SseB family protein [Thalassobius sp. I31.1]
MSDLISSPLDKALHAMNGAPDDEQARMQFYAEFADTTLILLLTAPAGDDSIAPHMFETDQGAFVVAFDQEERLADFAASIEGGAAEYAQLPGRALAAMLDGQGVGIALNPGVIGAEYLCTPEAVTWLVTVLEQSPEIEEARPGDISHPGEISESLRSALERAMRNATGLASAACLVKAIHRGGAEGLMLGLLDVAPQDEAALAGAVSNAVQFLGDLDLRLDVIFPEKASPFAAQLAQTGLALVIPEVEESTSTGPSAPGMDPETPPRLR